MIADLGTATTFDVVRGGKEYLGGVIMPGLRLSMEALEQNTARLPSVEIVTATTVLARSTVESIQAGLYFGHLMAMKGLAAEIREQVFPGEPVLVIGTGGFSKLFEHAKVFDVLLPDLVLIGLARALAMSEGRAGGDAAHAG
jgi:type III pantothenate kinase